MRCLLLSSLLLFCLCCLHAQEVPPTADGERLIDFPQGTTRLQYSMTLHIRNADLSGLLIIKREESGEIRGAMINEFGVSALNFTLPESRRKVTLKNVSALFNKWYIKRAIQADLRFLFAAQRSDLGKEQRKRMVELSDDAIVLHNLKHRMTYRLKPFNVKMNDTAE